MQNNYGFVKLCYGVVGSYKDTSNMTTDEVIKEFLKHEGVRSAEEYFNKSGNNTYGKFKREMLTEQSKHDKIDTGAIMGAYDDDNDPDEELRKAHAQKYYHSLRNSQKKHIIAKISRNSKIDEESVSKMYDHLFINKYHLEGGYKTFDEDYEISESIRRLREGTHIQPHDILLIHHEAYEHDLMNYAGLPYKKAHALANKKYNYQQALTKWKISKGKKQC